VIAIGTSGWHYGHWRETFYPAGFPVRRWLEWYAERFATVELNASFYRLPTADAFRTWGTSVPDDFVFAVKASRYLTHVRRLREPEEPVDLLLQRAQELGRALGPVLVQLPPDFSVELERLDRTLRAFGRRVRVAVELRHQSWWTDEVRAVLERHGAALCLSDRRGPLGPTWATADWSYVRFHAGRARGAPCYGRRSLDTWAERLEGRGDVYAYFNNDQAGCAPADARTLARACARRGITTTRVPAAGDVHPAVA